MKNHNHNHTEASKTHRQNKTQDPMMQQNLANTFLRKFWVVTILLMPLVVTNTTFANFFNIPVIDIGKWIQLIIATIIFGFAFIFFKHALHEIKTRRYGMMTLVSLAIGAGYSFSVISTFVPVLDVEFYLEISTLVWVLLFGHYLESRSRGAAGDALQEVIKLLPKKAHRIVNDETEDVDLEILKQGDFVLVKPGEKIPADGVVVKGEANVNEAFISGESKPIKKEKTSIVVAGAICLDGSLTVKINRVGENSAIGQIKKLISEAQQTKPDSQKLADKASVILTIVAVITSITTLLVWSLVVGKPFVFAITLAITVLVIACPHALGLAIPAVITITTSLAVKNGIFIKNLAKIEVIKKVNYVVFDKTGTLTEGKFGVVDIVTLSKVNKDDLLKIVASIEQHSSHIIGQSIVQYAKNKNIIFEDMVDFKNIAGKGVKARVSGTEYFVGNSLFIKEEINLSLSDKVKNNLQKERTNIYIADKNNILGFIVLADEIKQEAYSAVDKLHNLGIRVAMLTGDNESVAKSVAEKLKIDTYFSQVLPENKYTYIKDLQEKGNVVLMVGDGVNDAPALIQADAGVAIGAGTDVAVEAGDIVLTKNNPEDTIKLILLSRKVYQKIIQNLVWALGYNVIAIPAAAGVFATWGFFLRPEIGALAMSLSTVIVVINAFTLKKIDLSV